MEKGETVKKEPVITITLTLRGVPGALAHALANGLPMAALEEIRDGMTEELHRRQKLAKRDPRRRRPTRIVGRAGK